MTLRMLQKGTAKQERCGRDYFMLLYTSDSHDIGSRKRKTMQPCDVYVEETMGKLKTYRMKRPAAKPKHPSTLCAKIENRKNWHECTNNRTQRLCSGLVSLQSTMLTPFRKIANNTNSTRNGVPKTHALDLPSRHAVPPSDE